MYFELKIDFEIEVMIVKKDLHFTYRVFSKYEVKYQFGFY